MSWLYMTCATATVINCSYSLINDHCIQHEMFNYTLYRPCSLFNVTIYIGQKEQATMCIRMMEWSSDLEIAATVAFQQSNTAPIKRQLDLIVLDLYTRDANNSI